MNWLWNGSSDVVFKTKNENKKDKLKKSIFIFLGLAVIIVILAVFFFMLSYDFDIDNVIGGTGGAVSGSDNGYAVKNVSGEENILMYCTDDDEKNVLFMCAVRFNMDDKKIKVFVIPHNEKVFSCNSAKATASTCYNEGGALQLVKSAGEYVGVEFGKYIGCKEGSVEGITANFDALEFEFNKDMTFKKGADTVTFEEGKHTLSDDVIVKLLTYSSKQSYSSLKAELVVEMLRTYFNEDTLENRSIIYSNIISQVHSDISIVDFVSYKDCIVVLSSPKVRKSYIISENAEEFKE